MIVKDTKVNENTGTFDDWRLNLWGEARDGSNQDLHPLPDEHDDDHTIEDAIVVTTTVKPVPTKTQPATKPTEFTDRPVNTKPTDAAASPVTTPAADTSPAPAATTTTSSSTFLPSFFPTFGASKRTQIWIYASIGLIILFCIGLGVYFQIQRRRRIRNNPRDDYEFEMIEDEDEAQAMAGHSGRSQRRGGELYNAFAGESDEELFSEEEKPLYKDRPGGPYEGVEDYGESEKRG